jgi:fibronectin type 3 domain-containing protein
MRNAVPDIHLQLQVDARGLMVLLALGLLLVVSTACERERIIEPGVDTTPPLPPVGLLVEGARDGYIFIGWVKNREADLRGYVIHRAEEADPSGFTAVDTIAENYYFDEQRSYDTTYFYYVTAIDIHGNESVPSDTVSALSRNVYEPGPPANFQVNGYDDGAERLLRLTWSPVDEADLAGYRIYRSDYPFDVTAPALLVAETDAAFFDDLSVTQPGRRVYYAVTAVDRGGLEGEPSAVRSDLIASRPLLVSPANDTQAHAFPLLRWTRVPEAGAYLLAVSLSERSGEVWSRTVVQSAGDTLSFRFDGRALTVGQTYYWRVSSVTAANGKPNGVSAAWRFQVHN